MFKFTQQPVEKSVPLTTKVTIFVHKQTPRIVDQHMIDNLYKHTQNSTIITLSYFGQTRNCMLILEYYSQRSDFGRFSI